MAHFGFLTLSVMGHLFPMTTFAHELKSRRHQVTFFCFADAEEFLRRSGLDFVTIAHDRIPFGHTRRITNSLATMNGAKGVAYTIEFLRQEALAQFADLPDAIRSAGIDALVLDQFAMGGSTVADHLRLPRLHVAAALMANLEDGLPPSNVGFGPEQTILAQLRNRIAMALVKRVLRPLRATINDQRHAWNLPPYKEFFNERFAGGPQICQEPASFEYPRTNLPADFHFVGPLHRPQTRDEVPFPWHRLDGRPIIYASMGTLQNGLDWVFRAFAEGCSTLDVQLVLSLGGNLDPANFAGLPGDPIVVRFAPQLHLLERSSVCITHAGLNTALEALTHGVPMVAIPITNDQPGVAARIKWTGAGITLGLKKLNTRAVRSAVSDVLTNPSYRQNAQCLQREIAGNDSLGQASEIAETMLNERR